MNQLKFGLAITAVAFATSSQAQLLNPSFESEGANANSAANWTQFGNAYREGAQANSGSFSMKMFGNFSGGFNVTGAFQDFAISSGQSASVSGFGLNLSTDAMSGGNWALIKLVYRDAANQDVAFAESGQINASTVQDQWQALSANLGPAGANVTHGSVFLLFLQPEFAGGAAWFDDVQVEVVPEPASILAIGTGLFFLARRRKAAK